MSEVRDLQFVYAIHRLAALMRGSHARLRRAYAAGATKPVIDLLKSDAPLGQSEREDIADLLEGAWGRVKGAPPGSQSIKVKRELNRRIKTRRNANVANGVRESVEKTVETVVEEWNADPGNSGARITVEQMLSYRNRKRSLK